jgi:hypothetical protein
VVPPAALIAAPSAPPCASTIARQIARPTRSPCALVVTKMPRARATSAAPPRAKSRRPASKKFVAAVGGIITAHPDGTARVRAAITVLEKPHGADELLALVRQASRAADP